MPAQTYNFIDDQRLEQGATFDRSLQYFEEDGTTPIDLTGYTARMQIRRSINFPTAELDLTTTNGGIIISAPTTGVVRMFVDATDMAAVDITEGVYDLELVSLGGIVTRLLEGKVEIKKEVTR